MMSRYTALPSLPNESHGSRNIQTWLTVQAKTVFNFHVSHKNSDSLYNNIRNDKRNANLYEALI